jgi:hypothetical protein
MKSCLKSFLALSVTLGSSLAFAAPRPHGLPSHLVCVAPTTLPSAKIVKIWALNTNSPKSTFEDGFEDAGVENDSYAINFSDECESTFGYSFKIADLQALRKGADPH